MPLQDVVMKSFIVFISLTIVLSVVVLFVFKMINKNETLTPAESKKSE
jgi:LAS superfamily LD-carboxypeptidase LdcB